MTGYQTLAVLQAVRNFVAGYSRLAHFFFRPRESAFLTLRNSKGQSLFNDLVLE